ITDPYLQGRCGCSLSYLCGYGSLPAPALREAQSRSIPGTRRVVSTGSRDGGRCSAGGGPAPPCGPGDAEQGGAVDEREGELWPEHGWRGDRGVEKLAGGVEGEQGGDDGVWAGGDLDPDDADEYQHRFELAGEQGAEGQAEGDGDQAGEDDPGDDVGGMRWAGAGDHHGGGERGYPQGGGFEGDQPPGGEGGGRGPG